MPESVDWSRRGKYMFERHGVSVSIADDVLSDPNRVVIDPDYASTSGRSVRIIGYSLIAGEVMTLIVLEHDGVTHGVNGWPSNEKDRRIYQEAMDNGQD
ncbi:MAG: transposase [Actinomycetota bacterium]|nr:transposase [Actinomycetota bacterium]